MKTDALEIQIEHNPSPEQLAELGVFEWSIWTKKPSIFPWTYEEQETCYFLEGDVIVTPTGEEPVRLGKGDLAVFPKGMTCMWRINSEVKKHYLFG
jgi:hypothetical protein